MRIEENKYRRCIRDFWCFQTRLGQERSDTDQSKNSSVSSDFAASRIQYRHCKFVALHRNGFRSRADNSGRWHGLRSRGRFFFLIRNALTPALIFNNLFVPTDKSQESTSGEWSIISDVLSDILYRPGWSHVVHLSVHPWDNISFSRTLAPRSAGTFDPRRSLDALLSLVDSLLHLSQLHIR